MNVYEIVTDQIIKKLEEGTIPWRRPWAGGGIPKNIVSGKAYRGINTWLLNTMRYGSNYWLTYKQAKGLGGHIKKGEKSSIAVFYKMLEREEHTGNGEKSTVNFPMLRYYNVFNLDQCNGLEDARAKVETENRKPLDFNPIAECEKIITGFQGKPPVKHETSRPCYAPASDSINMPKHGLFDSVEEYYSTLFHELVHSTGHEKRLNRDSLMKLANYGSHEYSKEELVAEMGASFLTNIAGIGHKTVDNSASYIAGWLEKLKSDKRLIVQAGALAQKAADYVLGIVRQEKSGANRAND